MRIVVICVCRNHIDTVEVSLRHNMAFADVTVVLDRNSTDGTREVLADLQRTGLPIVVFDDPRLDIDEAEVVRRVCRNSTRFLRPDRIVLLFGDEFIVCEHRTALSEKMMRVGASGAVVACRTLSREIVNRGFDRTTLLQGNGFSFANEWEDLRVLTDKQVDEWDEVSSRGADGTGHGEVARLKGLFLAKAVTERSQARGYVGEERGLGDRVGVSGLGFPARQSSVDAASDTSTSFGRLVAANRARGRERAAIGRLSAAESNIAESGSLPVEFHSRNLYLDLPAFHYLWESYRPRTILDLGCGLGGYIEMFRRWGAEEVLGVDDFDEPEGFLAEGAFHRLDLRERFDLGKKYDLVICTEVLEHIEASFESGALSNIARHARRAILFSAARPGQPGVGHINCKPPQHWLDKWRALGWEAQAFDSIAARSLSTFYWFRRNLIVLVPAGDRRREEHGITAGDLGSLEAQHAPWLGEAPHVYEFPLEVELPSLQRRDSR